MLFRLLSCSGGSVGFVSVVSFPCFDGFVSVVSFPCFHGFVSVFRWFRRFRWFRSDGFVSVFRVLVPAFKSWAIVIFVLTSLIYCQTLEHLTEKETYKNPVSYHHLTHASLFGE